MASQEFFQALKKERDDKRLIFKIKDVDLSYVNSIRRIIISEIPNVAVNFDPYEPENNDVEIITNSGVLHNEFIGHRLSLIPICLSENEVNDFNMSDYMFSLKEKNTTSEVIKVTSKNIKIKYKNKELSQKERDEIFPQNKFTGDYILITKLKPNLYASQNGEEIDIEFKATKDVAKKHSRWCPVSLCSFYNEIDEEIANKIFEEKTKSMKKDEKEDFRSRFDCLERYRYFKKNEHDEPNSFIFQIETECKLRPEYLVFKALKILKEKFEVFNKNLNSNKDDIVSIKKQGNLDNTYQISTYEEDHTLINPIQSLILRDQIRKKKTDLNYIGYFQPHPLDKLIYIKLVFNNDEKKDIVFVKKFMTDAINDIIKEMDDLIRKWIEFSKMDKMDIVEVNDFIA